MVLCCINSSGQTNSAVSRAQLFSLPAVRLRTSSLEPGKDEVLPQLQSGQMTLSSEGSHSDASPRLDVYRRLEEGGYLTRLEPQSSVEQCVDSLFRPEVLHLRKVTVACTLVTAIKRKNPLCLLNPVFLNVSW